MGRKRPMWMAEWSMLRPFGGSLALMYCSGPRNGHARPHLPAAKARRRLKSVPHYDQVVGEADGEDGKRLY